MWSNIFFLSSVSLLLCQSVNSQLLTTTLPWANGNTEVLSLATNDAGVIVTETVSTITAGADGEALTATTPLATTTLATTTRKQTTTTTPAGIPTTTGQRVVGQETTAAPMKTTTYYYDPGDGVWTSAVWTATVTGPPTVATANVPPGTIQTYQIYQSTVNSVVLASAEAAAASASVSGKTGAASRRMTSSTNGWAAMGVAAVGAGVGAMLLS